MVSARRIIAVDKMAGKEVHARALGATHFIDSSTCDPVQAVKDLTGGLGADFTFEVLLLPAERGNVPPKEGGLGVEALSLTKSIRGFRQAINGR